MNVSKHALERYAERYIKPLETPKAYVTLHTDEVRDRIIKEMETATLLFTGQIKAKVTMNYYLQGNRIYITDTSNNTVVTTYPIEYGFGEEIDKTIASGLLAELAKAEQKAEQTRVDTEEAIADVKANLDLADNQIKSLEDKLDLAKKEKEVLKSNLDLAVAKNTEAIRSIKDVAYKIVNSKYYSMEVNNGFK
jgi:hypothetical protein